MQQSEYNELLKYWRFAIESDYALDQWTAEPYLDDRDALENSPFKDTPELKKLDMMLIKKALHKIATSGDDSKPIKKWWWHLDMISHKTYPPELLPEYLREIYLKAT